MQKDGRVAVIGAGLMGHGIALTFARTGRQVSIFDPDGEMLQSAPARIAQSLQHVDATQTQSETDKVLEKIELCDSVQAAVKDAACVFEAAPEKLALKQSIFEEVERHAPADALLASNTSVIQISKIMASLEGRQRALGTHWWNPPHMIPLVEVVKSKWTDPACANAMFGLLQDVGKVPVMVEKDVPGFIGNRLQHAMWREAISLVENGICTAKAVDDVVKASFGRRLAVLGPLESIDLIGVELTQDILNQVLFDLDTSAKASPYLQKLRDKGRTGMAAGAGFRDWQEGDLMATKARIAAHLKKLEAMLPK